MTMPASSYLGDQTLEAFTICGGLTGLALVRVNDDHLVDVPAECDGSLTQIILTFRALAVLKHLT
jgi:hypothetical protein